MVQATEDLATKGQAGPADRLATADRQIAKTKALIVHQEILVARLAALGGGDVTTGRQVLEEMRRSSRELLAQRRLLLQERASASR